MTEFIGCPWCTIRAQGCRCVTPCSAEHCDRGSLRELAQVRLADLLERDPAVDSSLDATIRRLFDPGDREKVTVSAFGSSL